MNEEERRPSPRDTGSKLSFTEWLLQPEMLVGFSAVLLSICGLFISIYETSLIRQEQRASVWPHVQVAPGYTADQVAFRVQNAGVGPARIRAAAVQYDGQTKATWQAFLEAFSEDVGLPDQIEGEVNLQTYQDLINGSVLPRDTRLNDIFRLTAVEGDSASRRVIEELQRVVEEGKVDITLCYCSVYDECWATNLYVRDNGRDANDTGQPRGSSHRVENCDERENSGI